MDWRMSDRGGGHTILQQLVPLPSCLPSPTVLPPPPSPTLPHPVPPPPHTWPSPYTFSPPSQAPTPRRRGRIPHSATVHGPCACPHLTPVLMRLFTPLTMPHFFLQSDMPTGGGPDNVFLVWCQVSLSNMTRSPETVLSSSVILFTAWSSCSLDDRHGDNRRAVPMYAVHLHDLLLFLT